MLGYFVEFIVLPAKTKKQDPRPDFRQNNQLHGIVANPKGPFPSLIFHLIRLKGAGLDSFLHVNAPPDSVSQFKCVYFSLSCVRTIDHGIESRFTHLSLRQVAVIFLSSVLPKI